MGNYDMILNMWELSKPDKPKIEPEKKSSSALILKGTNSPNKVSVSPLGRPSMRMLPVEVDPFELD